MPIELPIAWIIVLNVAGWLSIQMGFAWAFTKMPVQWFNPGNAWGWERAGRFYERVFRIKDWKDRLPDAARWFGGGFAKSTLTGTHRDYLQRFICETWRGELCHWTAIACAVSLEVASPESSAIGTLAPPCSAARCTPRWAWRIWACAD